MKKFFTLLCAMIVSAAMYAQDAYDPTAHTCFISGTSNFCSGNWTAEDAMTYDSKDGLWKITLNAKNANEVIEFKIVYESEWYGVDGNNAQFQVSEASDVDVTFNPTTFEITWKGDKVEVYDPNKIDYICAVGSAALLNGEDWNVTSEVNKMTKQDEGFYSFTVNKVAAGSYNIKFAANGAWAKQWGAASATTFENGVALAAAGGSNPSNFDITLEKGHTYTVTFELDFMDADNPTVTATWVADGDAEVTEDIYSIAGNMQDPTWNQADTSTELTKNTDGTYSYTFTNMTAGDYEFKVVTNHDWTVSYGWDGGNAWFRAEDGDNVTINFDPTTGTITIDGATAIKAVAANAAKSNVIYNLAGQRVTKATKGIYVINGKKVLK